LLRLTKNNIVINLCNIDIFMLINVLDGLIDIREFDFDGLDSNLVISA
jgi:hypothetical protein